jgi:hypothetical protein
LDHSFVQVCIARLCCPHSIISAKPERNCSIGKDKSAGVKERKKSPGFYYPQKVDIIVIRIDADDQYQVSKPCMNCIDFMKKLNCIDKIYYFNKDGEFTYDKLDNIETTHRSNGWRHYQSQTLI